MPIIKKLRRDIKPQEIFRYLNEYGKAEGSWRYIEGYKGPLYLRGTGTLVRSNLASNNPRHDKFVEVWSDAPENNEYGEVAP